MENFKIDKIKLVGDCLTASSFLSYCGPFNFVLRQKMVFEHWKKDIADKNIPNKEDFKLETFLTDDVRSPGGTLTLSQLMNFPSRMVS
jgi:dynein heavy chain